MTPLDAAGQILLDGLTDWVELDMARQYVQDAHPGVSYAELRQLTVDTISWLLAWDLVVVGDLGAEFTAWPLAHDESIARIERKWAGANRKLDRDAVCWLATTPAGDEVGRRLDADHQKQRP